VIEMFCRGRVGTEALGTIKKLLTKQWTIYSQNQGKALKTLTSPLLKNVEDYLTPPKKTTKLASLVFNYGSWQNELVCESRKMTKFNLLFVKNIRSQRKKIGNACKLMIVYLLHHNFVVQSLYVIYYFLSHFKVDLRKVHFCANS
jgi:hypothetical protein